MDKIIEQVAEAIEKAPISRTKRHGIMQAKAATIAILEGLIEEAKKDKKSLIRTNGNIYDLNKYDGLTFTINCLQSKLGDVK